MLILGYSGYNASEITQSDNVISMIYFSAAGFPVITLIISCLLMFLYNVDQDTLKEN